jgi:pimeloyl-ACP methyl ester carboxylesterase
MLAPDQRGHGESDKPEQGYDFASVTADLRAFLHAQAVERPLLVGHSWGAGVALAFEAQQPGVAAGLVLVDGGHSDLQAAGVSWEEAERLLTPPRLAGMPRPELMDRIRSGPLAEVWSPEVEAIVLANSEVDEQDRVAPRLSFERHMQVVRALWEQRATELYPRLTCPTTLVVARRAPTNEREARLLERKTAGVAAATRLNPGVCVHWMENSIHDIPLQHPGALAELIVAAAGG